MRQQQQFRGLGFVLIIALMLLLVTTFFRPILTNDEISYQQYQELLDGGEITRVIIHQNQQPPTGMLTINLQDNSSWQYYTSDVAVGQVVLRGKNIEFILQDVPQEKDL